MRLASVLVMALLLGLLAWLFLHRDPTPPPAPRAGRAGRDAGCAPAPHPVKPAPRPRPEEVRWLMVGAVESPEANQVSIEQDGALLREVLGPSGVTLFAGGPGSRDVQVASARPAADRFLVELADLLSPRGGRSSSYRRSRLPISAAATPEEIRSTLGALLAAGRSPLLLYVAGHGELAEHPADGYVTLWGGPRLSARELAGWLDGGTRPLQLVVTSCYAGAFAETIFRDADPVRGLAAGRCGVFATASDLPASGCDPNPDRQAQEAYPLYLLNALRSRDRDGRSVTVDLDGDGKVSLAEAHARARVELGSVDVPTSTSERWLRAVAPRGGPRAPVPLPEEQAVARALAERHHLPGEAAAARTLLDAREKEIERARKRLDESTAEEDRTARIAVAELLSRWPVLDDPWHPDFGELLRCQRHAIQAQLRASRAYAAYLDAREAAEEAEQQHWELRRRAAPLERLFRALDYIEAAERLRARGGAAWHSFAAILACERRVP